MPEQVGWQHPTSGSLVNVGKWDEVYVAEGYAPVYRVTKVPLLIRLIMRLCKRSTET
jgi:hypothetical protein